MVLFGSLECELLQRRKFQTKAEARMALFVFIASRHGGSSLSLGDNADLARTYHFSKKTWSDSDPSLSDAWDLNRPANIERRAPRLASRRLDPW